MIIFYLWLADIIESISVIAVIISLVFIFADALIIIKIISSSQETSIEGDWNYFIKRVSLHKRLVKNTIIVQCVALLLAFTLPSKNTILIGLSLSVTEDVIQTPTAQKALKLLNIKLDEMLDKNSKIKE